MKVSLQPRTTSQFELTLKGDCSAMSPEEQEELATQLTDYYRALLCKVCVQTGPMRRCTKYQPPRCDVVVTLRCAIRRRLEPLEPGLSATVEVTATGEDAAADDGVADGIPTAAAVNLLPPGVTGGWEVTSVSTVTTTFSAIPVIEASDAPTTAAPTTTAPTTSAPTSATSYTGSGSGLGGGSGGGGGGMSIGLLAGAAGGGAAGALLLVAGLYLQRRRRATKAQGTVTTTVAEPIRSPVRSMPSGTLRSTADAGSEKLPPLVAGPSSGTSTAQPTWRLPTMPPPQYDDPIQAHGADEEDGLDYPSMPEPERLPKPETLHYV
jgi:hypothetical protein